MSTLISSLCLSDLNSYYFNFLDLTTVNKPLTFLSYLLKYNYLIQIGRESVKHVHAEWRY